MASKGPRERRPSNRRSSKVIEGIGQRHDDQHINQKKREAHSSRAHQIQKPRTIRNVTSVATPKNSATSL